MDKELCKAAGELVKEAKQLEEVGEDDRAEYLYDRAEDFYERSGVDGTWFDDAELASALDEPNDEVEAGIDPMLGIALFFPKEALEGSDGVPEIPRDDDDGEWIVINPRLIEDVEP